ncbi:MAG: 2-hydroxychromene-2-carboxylate isomerase [Polyangiaceae bacterium]
MSPRRFDFWFDFSCPYAYLASTQVEAMASRAGAEFAWCPMLLGGVFRAVGTPQNLSEVLSPPKTAHNLRDMQRWAELFGVPLTMPSGHPLRTVEALRVTLASGIHREVVRGFYDAYWVRGEAPSDDRTMVRVLREAGFDDARRDDVLARAKTAAVKDDLRARTERAIALGVFGAPAFVTDEGELYWGQDRMVLVERDLRAPRTPKGRT